MRKIVSLRHNTKGEKRQLYKSLAIVGGGSRGIISATILGEIEKRTHTPINRLFNLIGGTSTGGIQALGLTTPECIGSNRAMHSADALLKMYTSESDEIFRPNPTYDPDKTYTGWAISERLKDLTSTNTKYLSPTTAFKTKFGETSLKHALTNILITACPFSDALKLIGEPTIRAASLVATTIVSWFSSSVKPKAHSMGPIHQWATVFTREGQKRIDTLKGRATFSSQKDFYMYNVASATSAAPSYFPSMECDDLKVLLDGGILYNNPANLCFIEAQSKGVNPRNMLLLSLGTGTLGPLSDRFQARSIGKTIFNLYGLWSDSYSDSIDTSLRENLSNRYYRFQKIFDGNVPDLADITPENIAFLQDAGRQLIETEEDSLNRLCRTLAPEEL